MSLNSMNTKLALLGEDGKFYAVIKMADESSTRSLETANSIPSLTQETNEDTFTCGQCKLQVNILEKFLAHKQVCLPSPSRIPTTITLIQDPTISNTMITLPPPTTPQNYQQATTEHEQQDDETRQIIFINEAMTTNELCIQASNCHDQGMATSSSESNIIQSNHNIQDTLISQNIYNQEELNPQNQQKSANTQNFKDIQQGQSDDQVGSSENLFLARSAKFSEGILTEELDNSVLKAAQEAKLIHSEPMLQALGEDSMDTTAVKNQLLSLSKESNKNSQQISPLVDFFPQVDKDKKAVCTYCGKGFRKTHDLSQHIRCHTGEKPYQCVVCGRGFAQKSNVKKHMVTHKVLPTKPVRQQDTDNVQATSDTFYQCSICKESYDDYPLYKSHLKVHDAEKVYRCIVTGCGECFQTVEDYVDHITSHQNMEYKCHACPDKFTDLNDLNLHQFTHLTDRDTREQQMFECSKCKLRYSSQTALDHHLETTVHSFSCAVCAKSLSSLRLLRKHMTANHSDISYSCDICGQSVKTTDALKRHKLVHSNELPFSCNECGARFNRKDKLKRHGLSHNWRKKFKCPFQEHMNCDKEFHRLDKLKQHITTHGNIRCFSCTLCEAKYTRKEHLKNHVTKKHSQATKSAVPNI